MIRTPVVFIHGAWLHALSWERWEERFAAVGYTTRAPGWPGEAATVREARERPEALAGIGLDDLTDHHAAVVASCEVPPVIVGHSVGGLIAQQLIGAGLGRAAVAIAPAPFSAVAPPPDEGCAGGLVDVPLQLPVGRFREVFANAVSSEEATLLHERYAVPGPGRLLGELGRGGAARRLEAMVDTANTARGPLLLVSGQEDLVVPDRLTRGAYKEYGDSTAPTDLKQFADRGHSLVVDSGWRSVADYVLGWLDRRGVRP
ncbi:alpha/beta hydrolase [Kitasatospora azatica]|uniref:alpha/beta hydrolase n=1 Tax=Kitasatospora azatica TaxID=58347 RepID=UPI00055D612C|nr:alpha/beta fold hydrolase [Kitasatospora azatica]